MTHTPESPQLILKVAVSVPLSRAFDYLPRAGSPIPEPGCRVQIPFGTRQRVVQGVAMHTELFDIAAERGVSYLPLRECQSHLLPAVLGGDAPLAAGSLVHNAGASIFAQKNLQHVGQVLEILTAYQSRMLDLIDSKIDEAEGYFDRPVDEPGIYVRLVDIGKAAGRDDLVTKFGRRTAQIEAADLEFRARLQAFFGATSRAVEIFQRSVDLTPDFEEAVDGLGRAERRVAKSERTIDKLAAKAKASGTASPTSAPVGGVRASAHP